MYNKILMEKTTKVYTMKRILVICPFKRDYRELTLLKTNQTFVFQKSIITDYKFISGYPESMTESFILENLKKLDLIITKEKINAVLSTTDLGTLLATIIAKKHNMIAPDPQIVAQQQYKYLARLTHQHYIPEATPQFELLKKPECSLSYPFVIKPVRGSFSRGVTIVQNEIEFKKAYNNAYTHIITYPWKYIINKYVGISYQNSWVLAEELCTGLQCTIEGFVYKQNVTIFGITDSVMLPNSISFKQFNYPSSLPRQVQETIIAIASKLIKGIGFNNGCFNIECIYNPDSNSVHVIEMNPRLASQFADLYEKVDGFNSYDVLVSIATGQESIQITKGQGHFNVASSCVLRTSHDKIIKQLPSQDTLKKINKIYPDSRIQLVGQEGKKLSDYEQDGHTFRYGLIHIGGKNLHEIDEKSMDIQKMLGIQLVDIKTN